MNRKTFILNWKMYKNLAEAEDFIDRLEVSNNQIIIASHNLLLNLKQEKFKLAAQNISAQDGEGAYTGEVSAYLLKQFNVNYVILGHSERIKYFKEEFIEIRQKLYNCLKNNLKPILCIGETKEDFDNNNAFNSIRNQLNFLFENVPEIEEIIIAYEPYWAVGGEIKIECSYIENVIKIIKEFFVSIHIEKQIKIVYGGSVNSSNFEELMKVKELSGFMLGRLSLDVDNLNNLIKKVC